MKIDVHAHYYPPEYTKEADALELAAASSADRNWSKARTARAAGDPARLSVEDCIAAMDAAGVDLGVLSLSIPNVYFEDPAKSRYLAQMANDAYAEICRRYPERFTALASIPWEFPDLAVEEMHRAIEKLGMCGLVIGSNIRGKTLDDPLFRPVFEEADRLGLAILIHPMVPFTMDALRQYGLGASYGYLFDTTIAMARLVYSCLFERCTNVKMILPHMGGFIPFNMERGDNSRESRPENFKNMTMLPSEQFKRHYYDCANFYLPGVKCGYETFGADHLLIGSDWPYRPDGAARAIANVRAMGLSPEEEEKIFSGNALRIFRR